MFCHRLVNWNWPSLFFLLARKGRSFAVVGVVYVPKERWFAVLMAMGVMFSLDGKWDQPLRLFFLCTLEEDITFLDKSKLKKEVSPTRCVSGSRHDSNLTLSLSSYLYDTLPNFWERNFQTSCLMLTQKHVDHRKKNQCKFRWCVSDVHCCFVFPLGITLTLEQLFRKIPPCRLKRFRSQRSTKLINLSRDRGNSAHFCIFIFCFVLPHFNNHLNMSSGCFYTSDTFFLTSSLMTLQIEECVYVVFHTARGNISSSQANTNLATMLLCC